LPEGRAFPHREIIKVRQKKDSSVRDLVQKSKV